MPKPMLHLLILLIALVSFISPLGQAAAEAVDDALLPTPTSIDPAEEFFDDLVSYVWKLITPALSMPPPAVSSWNH